MDKKILIVEDDSHISKLVKYNLEKANFICHAVITGEDAIELLEREYIDLIVLDVMLPKMDGLEACRHIRQNPDTEDIPIIMLTAKGEEVDRIVGFELGADDYMVKPFSPRELILRIKAMFRRGSRSTPKDDSLKPEIKVGNILINLNSHKVYVSKKEIFLTSMELKLLATLMQRIGRVQSRDLLLSDVWDMNTEVTTRTIDTHVKRLRQKLGKSGKLIETVRGFGYVINEGK
ncbi:MAG: DNA-binding response OmpR family regulator [Candidatus Omnitrophota bacterium]|jgi:DNA-binding response OmpR family regulator